MRAWPIFLLVPWCFGHVGGCGHDVVGAAGEAQFDVALDPDTARTSFVHVKIDGLEDAAIDLVVTVGGHPTVPGAVALGVDDDLGAYSTDGVLWQQALVCTGRCAAEYTVQLRTGPNEGPTRWQMTARVRAACEECGDTPLSVRVNVHEHL